MSLDGVYDENNVFALILSGKLPSQKLYEDEETYAFLDIMPQSPGHALVISKTSRARNLLEMEESALAAVMATAKKVATALRRALDPDGLQLAQFNGSDAGQTVFHFHMHIIPRWKGGETGHLIRFRPSEMADADELAALAEKIRACF